MDTSFDLITLGETMMRLVPPHSLRLGQSSTLELSFGGAESNVASNLARLGRRVSWWSRLPNNPLGQQLVSTLRGYGVNTDDVLFCEGERLGTYYIEYGEKPRGIRVLYDRDNSATSFMQPSDLPDSWLESSRWLHMTGITPALSPSCKETVEYAIQKAKTYGSTVSFDVNYRSLLWTPDDAGKQLEAFCHLADLVFVARRDAQQLFGVSADELNDVVSQLQTRWGGIVVVTDADSGSAGSGGETIHLSPALSANIVDRIGAGDAFASGVIDRLLDNASLAEALQFGTALATLKLSISGDIALVTRAEVEQVLYKSQNTLHR